MTLAWKSDFSSGQKMVLLALCDNANDQGECYPSISMLAEKCSIGRSSIFEHMGELEKLGAVAKHCRTGRSTIYKIDPSRFCTRPDSAPVQKLDVTRPETGRTPVQKLDVTRPETGPITIKEPSIEPSRKQKRGADAPPCPDDVDKQVYGDWLQLRKAKNAPVTETVLKNARKQSELAEMTLTVFFEIWCARGSVGLQAEWLRSADKNLASETVYQKSMRLRVAEISPALARPEPGRVSPDDFFLNLAKTNILEISQ